MPPCCVPPSALLLAGVTAFLAVVPAGATSPTRAFRLKINEHSGAGRVVGHLDVRLPETFTKDTTIVATPDAPRFTITDAAGCVAHMVISVRPQTTRASTLRQIQLALPPLQSAVMLQHGPRAHGNWQLNELKPTRTTRGLYGIGPTHITGNTYVQIRVGVRFDGDCSDATVRSGPVAATFARILSDGRLVVKYTEKRAR